MKPLSSGHFPRTDSIRHSRRFYRLTPAGSSYFRSHSVHLKPSSHRFTTQFQYLFNWTFAEATLQVFAFQFVKWNSSFILNYSNAITYGSKPESSIHWIISLFPNWNRKQWNSSKITKLKVVIFSTDRHVAHLVAFCSSSLTFYYYYRRDSRQTVNRWEGWVGRCVSWRWKLSAHWLFIRVIASCSMNRSPHAAYFAFQLESALKLSRPVNGSCYNIFLCRERKDIYSCKRATRQPITAQWVWTFDGQSIGQFAPSLLSKRIYQ